MVREIRIWKCRCVGGMEYVVYAVSVDEAVRIVAESGLIVEGVVEIDSCY